MRIPRTILGLLLLIGSPASAADVAPATTQATAGPIRYEAFVRKNPALRGFVARVDLTDPRIEITAATGGPDPDGPGGEWETILAPTSDLARRHGFDLAVNGTFFACQRAEGTSKSYPLGAPARASQPLMAEGKLLSAARRGDVLVVPSDNRAYLASITAEIPPDARTMVGGSHQIVFRGQNRGNDDPPAPRTAVGIADAGQTLVLLVVDGRRPEYSQGLSTRALAEEMIRLGCTDALNLDGGGSSTMVRKTGPRDWRVLNTPSDGSQMAPLPLSIERPVANVLGVRLRKPAS